MARSITLWNAAYAWTERLAEQDADERQVALQHLAQEDPDLHAQVLSLIEAQRELEAENFLGRDALASTQAAGLAGAAENVSALAGGQLLGPYRLERALGSGGMGEVWLARRNDGLFETPVALKLLHAHLATSSVRERFVREGRILGELSHPNVAHLLDAGALADGRLYLAIEFVDGQRVDQWCEAQALDLAARLRLFVQVCEAVSHAHARLVVHRDLKPSNILVNADGSVKLLDFGIAKLIDTTDQGAAATELTRLGGRVLTPEYAAPEQILGAAVTVATDVYSLGVLLYLLLTRRRPYGLSTTTAGALEREVLEIDPPPPSRVVESRSLRTRLLGDLDTITLKALKKAPAERYASVAALAEDIGRYLHDQPVLARPDAFSYRARKFVRRHRLGVLSGIAVAIAMLAGILGVLWQAHQTRMQAVIAAAEARKANAVKDFILGIFEQNRLSHPDGAGAANATARDLLDQGARRLRTDLQDQPELRAELLGVVSGLYNEALLSEQALALGQERVTVLRGLGTDTAAADLPEALAELGESYLRASRYEDAERAAQETLQLLDARRDATALARVLALRVLAGSAQRTRAVDDPLAPELLQRALGLIDMHHPEDPAQVAILLQMAITAIGREDDAAAEAVLRDALARLDRPALSRRRSERAEALSLYGLVLHYLGRVEEAEHSHRDALAILQEVAGPDHALTLQAQEYLSTMLVHQGRLVEAETLLRATAASFERIRGALDPVYTAAALNRLAEALLERGRLEEAAHYSERAMNALRQPQTDDDNLTSALQTQVRVERARGRLAQAGAAHEELRALVLRLRGEEGGNYSVVLAEQAHLQLAAGDLVAAEALLRSLRTRYPVEDTPDTRDILVTLGLTRVALQQADAASALREVQGLHDRLMRVPEESRSPVREAQVQLWLGEALRASGDPTAAIAALERSQRLREQTDDPDSPWLAQVRIALAQAQRDRGDGAQTQQLLEQAAAAQARHPLLDRHLRQALREAQKGLSTK